MPKSPRIKSYKSKRTRPPSGARLTGKQGTPIATTSTRTPKATRQDKQTPKRKCRQSIHTQKHTNTHNRTLTKRIKTHRVSKHSARRGGMMNIPRYQMSPRAALHTPFLSIDLTKLDKNLDFPAEGLQLEKVLPSSENVRDIHEKIKKIYDYWFNRWDTRLFKIQDNLLYYYKILPNNMMELKGTINLLDPNLQVIDGGKEDSVNDSSYLFVYSEDKLYTFKESAEQTGNIARLRDCLLRIHDAVQRTRLQDIQIHAVPTDSFLKWCEENERLLNSTESFWTHIDTTFTKIRSVFSETDIQLILTHLGIGKWSDAWFNGVFSVLDKFENKKKFV